MILDSHVTFLKFWNIKFIIASRFELIFMTFKKQLIRKTIKVCKSPHSCTGRSNMPITVVLSPPHLQNLREGNRIERRVGEAG